MTTIAVASGNTGPVGKRRGTGFVILIGILTLGIYWVYWAYKSHEEIKQHSGQGVGGVLGLVIYILIGAVTAFLLPSEIGKMYALDGRQPPVNGWTGLWMIPGAILLIPAFVWIVKVQGSMNRYWETKSAG